MNEHKVYALRNVAIVSNAGAGKTTLTEALLYNAGAVSQPGSVSQGTTLSDFEPEEVHRKSSLSTSILHWPWNHITLNLVDTPGSLVLVSETLTALRAVDGVVLLVNPVTGVRSELARVCARIRELRLPCLVFANDLDKEEWELAPVLEMCRKELEIAPLPLTLPVGKGAGVRGVVDVLTNELVSSRPDSAKLQRDPAPDALKEEAGEARKRIVEAAAESDDLLLEQYLGGGELSPDQVMAGLRAGVHGGRVVPLYCGSALRNVGVWSLLNGIAEFLPSPAQRPVPEGVHPDTGETVIRGARADAPFSAFVFKTLIDPFIGRLSYVRILSGTLTADSALYNSTRQSREKGGHLYAILGKKYTSVPSAEAGDIVAVGKLKDTQTGDTLCEETAPVRYSGLILPRPVISFAIEPKSKADVEKVSLGLHKLIEEDPTLEFQRNADTKEMVLSGMGQLHIDIALEKLQRKYGAEVTLHTPKIPYRETVRSTAQAQGKYKKQTGGHGQYGDCWLEVTPLPRGEGFKFLNRIVGGAIPRNFIPAVEKGVVDAMQEGVLAGFPVVDVQVAVYDGSYHVVDSSEMAFKIAASMGFKKAMEAARPVLLEPMMTVEVEAPTDHIGAVIGDLNARRGRILTVSAQSHTEVIKAVVPLAEMLKYAPTLNSITGGRGSYVMEFARYEEVPRELTARILDEHRAGRQAVAAH